MSLEGSRQDVCRVLGNDPVTIAVPERQTPCSGFIDPNPGLRGVYRYQLPAASLDAALANLAKLDSAAKVGLLANARATLWRQRTDPSWSLRLAAGLDGELNRTVLEEELTMLAAVSEHVPPDNRAEFRAYMADRLASAKARAKIDRSSNGLHDAVGDFADGTQPVVTPELIRQLGELAEDEDVLALSERTLDHWLEAGHFQLEHARFAEPDGVTLTTFGLGGVRADDPEIDQIHRILRGDLGAARAPRARQEERRALLVAMGSATTPRVYERALDGLLLLELDPQEVWTALAPGASRPQTLSILVDWIVSRWSIIRTKWSDDSIWPLVSVLRFANDEQRAKLESLLGPIVHRQPGGWLESHLAWVMRARDNRAFGRSDIAAYFAKGPGRAP
jgi:hypothetical protein